jgi:E3 ubiquitin-protein ligase ZNF598
MVYENYAMLKKHFDASHFACNEPECVEMRVVVFATQEELEYHTSKVHKKAGNKGKFNAGTLLGVRVEEEDDEDGYYLKGQPTIRGGGRGGRGGRGGGVATPAKFTGGDRIGKDFANVV